jgi:hypothetical protein
MSIVRTVPSPHRKLNALCAAAAPSGGTLTTFTAVAKAIDVSPGRITQLFGHGTEQEAAMSNGARCRSWLTHSAETV